MQKILGVPSVPSDDPAGAEQRAARLGGRVGSGAAVLTGTLLSLYALSNPALVACVVAATVAVAWLAQRVGQVAGPAIARRSALSALGVGVGCGLICLLGCALSAAGLGLIWAGYDGFRDPYLVRSYLGKPFLAVLGYGLFPAIVVGALSGIVLWGLTRRAGLRSRSAD